MVKDIEVGLSMGADGFVIGALWYILFIKVSLLKEIRILQL